MKMAHTYALKEKNNATNLLLYFLQTQNKHIGINKIAIYSNINS